MNQIGEAAGGAMAYVGQDENEADPAGLDFGEGEPATMLLVGRGEVSRGEADLALQALAEQALAPVEVVVVQNDATRPQPAYQGR